MKNSGIVFSFGRNFHENVFGLTFFCSRIIERIGPTHLIGRTVSRWYFILIGILSSLKSSELWLVPGTILSQRVILQFFLITLTMYIDFRKVSNVISLSILKCRNYFGHFKFETHCCECSHS
jgi:hypothetical protein